MDFSLVSGLAPLIAGAEMSFITVTGGTAIDMQVEH